MGYELKEKFPEIFKEYRKRVKERYPKIFPGALRIGEEYLVFTTQGWIRTTEKLTGRKLKDEEVKRYLKGILDWAVRQAGRLYEKVKGGSPVLVPIPLEGLGEVVGETLLLSKFEEVV